jgi:Bacterial protein of unknown function (DUF916)
VAPRARLHPGRVAAPALCLTLSLFALVAPALAAGATASFSVRPGHYDAGDQASRAYFKRVVAAGGTFSDTVVVANSGQAPVTLLVNAVDGLTGQTSGSVYANRAVPRRKAGAWVQPAQSRVTVAPGTERAVAFTVRVPGRATPGDHLAGLAFQDADVETSSGSFRVRTILREVVGVLITFPGPARARLRLGHIALRTLPGTHLGSVVVGLGNTGRRLCKPVLAVTLSTPAGRERLIRRLDTVLPGDTIDYPLILRHDLKPARYMVRARASCAQATSELQQSVALHATLRGAPDSRVAQAATVVKVTHSGTPLWVVAALAGVAAVGGAGIGWVLRHRRKPV